MGYEAIAGAMIERGEITEKKGESPNFLYRVKSLTREGVETRWIEDIHRPVYQYLESLYTAYTAAHEGTPFEKKFDYAVGDTVYFFVFGDGRGQILGAMALDR